MTSIHDRQTLRSFCQAQIGQFHESPIVIKLSIGWGPPIICTVYEFTPTSLELGQQAQYITNPSTGRSERIIKRSPPLALFHVQDADARSHEKYMDNVIQQHLAALPLKFFQEEKDDFSERLLQLMVDYFKDETDGKVSAKMRLSKAFERLSADSRLAQHHHLLGQIMRLILITYMMGRTLTFTRETQDSLLEWLTQRHRLPMAHDMFISPRMANRQLKYLFSLLHREYLTNLLNKLQQILHSSNVRGHWMPAFLCLLGLAIAQEDMQRTVYIIMDDRWRRGEEVAEQATHAANAAVASIDEKFHFLCSLFYSKFNKSLNPVRDSGYEHMPKWIGDKETEFVRKVKGLVDEKGKCGPTSTGHVVSVLGLNLLVG
jgi:hypothetical protein